MRMFEMNKVFTTPQRNEGHANNNCHYANTDTIEGSEPVEATLQKNIEPQYYPQSIIVSAPIHMNSQRLITSQEAASSCVDIDIDINVDVDVPSTSTSTPRNDTENCNRKCQPQSKFIYTSHDLDNSHKNCENKDQHSKARKSIKADDEGGIQSTDSRDDISYENSLLSDCRDDASLSHESILNCSPDHEEYQAASTLPLDTLSSLHTDHNSECFYPSSKPRTTRSYKYQSILRPSKYSNCSTDTNSDSACQKTTKPKSSARFSIVEIREYPITLSDNPGGVQGPPICLDWEYDVEQTVVLLLEEYEATRPPRRCQEEMYLPECLRRWKLLEKGVSMRAMQRACKSAETVRRQRRNTIKSLQSQAGPLSGFTDMVRQLVGS